MVIPKIIPSELSGLEKTGLIGSRQANTNIRGTYCGLGDGAMLIERDCLELDELIEEFDITPADIREKVGKGELCLSVRLVARPVEFFTWEENIDGLACRVPWARDVYTGVVDLHAGAAFDLVSQGSATVWEVIMPNSEYAQIQTEAGLQLTWHDALVRVENIIPMVGQGTAVGEEYCDIPFDYRHFQYRDVSYAFSYTQAKVLRFMYEEYCRGTIQVHHLRLLDSVGTACTRVGSLFSRHTNWRDLLYAVPRRRGYYMLDPNFSEWLERVQS
ncbi:hypothetical protein [Pseudophaeobacter sp. TrK17]|jgi:hypothetical protein|uniref:hypothetical protein n=1 Tax=Pseudophaeobacter sp. TrK17 TaxID=2815167 RepID=UPI0035D0B9AB